MSIFSRIGRAVGYAAVDELIESGELNRMIDDAIADHWEKMAKDPKYAKHSDLLNEMAQKVRRQPKK